MPSSGFRNLLLPPVFEALGAWRTSPGPDEAERLHRAVAEVAEQMGLALGGLRISAPPLPELDAGFDVGGNDEDATLVGPDDGAVGTVRVGGDEAAVRSFVRTLGLVVSAERARALADRSAAQLQALDQAVRGIGGVLDPDRVLQLIADRVRDLVRAQYAAIGIVDAEGRIERFFTSGISEEDRARIELPRGRGLLGLIIRENRTYRIADITTHPQRYGFPPHHPPMDSFLGMPIIAGGSPVGRLYLTNKLGAAEFSSEDEALVEMFARHAGIAIENARLHDEVRRLAIVDERDRISRDLHDSVIQAIYAQTLALDDVPDLVIDDPAEAGRRADAAVDALHAVIRDIRNFIFGLRPVLLEGGSIADGLEHLASELRRNGGIEVELALDPDVESLAALPMATVAELLAITREGLSNIARHAAATTARLALTISPSALHLELADDGRGFDTDQAAERGHHGLANMRARTEGLNGTFSVSSDQAGTRIIIEVPRPTAIGVDP
jgi:signal transduction histidine kinase